MALGIEVLQAGTAPSLDVLFLPYSDIDGVENDAELSTATPEEVDAKVGFGLLSKIHSHLASLESPFAISSTIGNPNGIAPNVFNQLVSFQFTYVVDLVNNTGSIVPIASASTNFVALDNVFPNVTVVTSSYGGQAPTDGIGIPFADLVAYNVNQFESNISGNLGDDRRDTIEAIVRWIFDSVSVRSASQISGVSNKTKNNGSAIAPPANFFTDGDFNQAQSNNLFVVTGTYSMTYEFAINFQTGMYENRVV